MSDREELELDKNVNRMRLELEEALDILTCHENEEIKSSREGECCILDSYPLSMTLIRCENDKEKLGLIFQLREFSKMVKGSYWMVLEDNKDPRNLCMLEFFNYNDGVFRNKTFEVIGDKSEREILQNYFSHSNSILNMNGGNKSEIGNDKWMMTTLKRRRDIENSRNNLGLAFCNSFLKESGERIRSFDLSSLTFMIKFSEIGNISELISNIESLYGDFWLNKMEESFLTVFSFSIENRLDCQVRFEDELENLSLSSPKKDAYMIHIFTSPTDYAMITSTYNWSSYISSLKDLAQGEVRTEFITQKLIYNSLDSFEDLNVFRTEDSERDLEIKENMMGGGNLDSKSATTTTSNYYSTDSCKLVDPANGFSSTDLDSVTTSINSSTENLVLSKKGSTLEGLDENEESGNSDSIRAFGDYEVLELEDPLLVSEWSNLGFWESAVVGASDSVAISNIRKKNLCSSSINNNDNQNERLAENQEVPVIQESVKEEEFYECREMKFDTYTLKAKLAKSVWGGTTCTDRNCMQCFALPLANACPGRNLRAAESERVWCKEGFTRFCEIYKSMGVVELTKKSELGNGRKAWLIREFIGDELTDQVFCYGLKRRRRSIKGGLRTMNVYLVGDFNNWNKTSHPMQLETESICLMNQEMYEDYPSIPHFMKSRVYSIILDENKLENFLRCNPKTNSISFKIRIVTSKADGSSEGNMAEASDSMGAVSSQELETYRLLSYSRSLATSGIKDSAENALMNCNFYLKGQRELESIKDRGLKYPLPRCVLRQKEAGVLKPNKDKAFESNEKDWQIPVGTIVKELVTNFRQSPLYIYEANIAFSSKNKGEFGTFVTFREKILPRISRGGYNCLLLTGLLEHYQSFSNSQYPFNYFIPYSKYGTLEEFKDLMDDCHSRGIAVLIDFNLAFADITNSNSMLQPCDREVNNNLSNQQDIIETDEMNMCSGSEVSSGNISREGSFIFGNGNSGTSTVKIDELFLDDSVVDLYESFMLTNLNTFNPSFFKHTPDVISSLFAYNKSYSRLNLGYIPMLAQILSSLHYLMTQLGIDGFRFTVPDLSEEQEKYSCISSILALINDTIHTIKPFAVTIANELLLRGNKDKACSELTVPLEYGGMGFDYVWNTSICSSLQGIILKNPSSLNIKKDIIDELLPQEDKMRNSNKKIRILYKNREKQNVISTGDNDNLSNSYLSTGGSDLHTVEFVSRNLYGIESLEMKTVTQNPLRIAMFSWESLHTHLVGGVSPHVSELSASLVRLGHEVHLFTRATTSAYLIKVHDGVLYHECPFQLNSDFVTEITNMCNSFVYYMQRWEDGLTKVPDHPMLVNVRNGYRFDICHCHDWLAAPVLTSLRRIGNNNRTTIFTVHSTEYGRCGNQSFGGQSSRIADIEREGCHTADRLICVSGVLAEEVCRLFGVNRSKIKVIYNGIHCRTFDRVVMDDAGEVKRQYGIGPLEPTFLCVARMALQKGVDLLIEAVPGILKYRSDTKFIIVGDGHQKDEIVRRSHQLGIYNSVRFVGKKSGDDVIRLYKACDAVVVPSRNEPFGIVVLEGWTAGKPVVATTSGGPRDFLTPNVDGYLVEPCKDSIAWGCCEILKNFDHSRWMGSRGRVKAAYSFSWDSIAQITSFLYFEQCNVLDVTPSLILKPNSPIILQAFGENALHHHMMVFDGFDKSVFALKQLKLLILTTMAFAKNGVFQSMGSEFGNPDCFDLPRPNNDMDNSKMYCKWDLADNKSLKFKHLEFFNTLLIRLEKFLSWIAKNSNIQDYGISNSYVVPFIECVGGESELGKNGSNSVCISKLTSPLIKGTSCSLMHSEVSPDLAFSKRGVLLKNQAVIRRLEESSGDSTSPLDNESVIYLDSTPPSNGKEGSKSIQNIFSRGKSIGNFSKDSLKILTTDSLYNSSSNINVVLCHELDKVMVIERNSCVFVFNFSEKCYNDYGFGISSELPQSLVIDTQDERFGGDKKYHNTGSFCCSSVKSEQGFKILGSNSEPTHISTVDNKTFQNNFQYESPYRFINTKSLKQTVFLNMSPFSAYILAPSNLVQDFPCETVGDKLFSQSIDSFVDSLGLFC
ncbi:LPS glycosyltransferase of cyanobacterial origin [Cryptosporidium sp. chipmunk genotype I]|uniref:LPS glycosyltransferase of cyanobacterial origin n=1 Tax=Cryptosporidium sp. chipmunk genotype I TaxID=1280935 RepID=UPI00351A3ACB|nr:LPS glycosyltransferase of cyanobacterial origin [Cryptosporidium sp. chipmunk genotype I]